MCKKFMSKKLYLFIISFVFIIVLFPYLKASRLTNKYGSEFKSLYTQIGMFDKIEYFRVIDIDEDTAKVCYILKDHAASIIVNFEKSENAWNIISWDTIWSKSGSADGLYWPLYF